MNTLKPCPFCGGTKICTEKGINLNYCDNCSAESNIEHWNARPIEDALNKRIGELAECVGSMMADVYTLKSRIAELEAESERFTVHSHIERQDDKLSEREVCEVCGGDGTVLLRDGYEGQVIATAKCIYCNGTGRVSKESEE